MRSRLFSTTAILALVGFGVLNVSSRAQAALLGSESGTEADLGVASSEDLGCPSPPSAPHGIQVWLRVTKWCGLSAVRGQAQIKLQLQIYNSGRRTLGIRPEHLRLIVASFNVDRWSPARTGQTTSERPFRTIYHHEPVWAVPPNAEDAYDPIPGVPHDKTFATHWGQTQLSPGEIFHPSYKRGDLVFYLPYLANDPRGQATAEDIIGMAYVYRDEIVLLCPKERWGSKEPANTF
jgi:hypothetical protein